MQPVYEKAFIPEQLQKVSSVISTLYPGCDHRTFLLHSTANGIIVNGVQLTSCQHRLSTSKVYAHSVETNISKFAEIEYFVECEVSLDASSSQQRRVKVVLAYVSWFMEHSCRLWFGKPTEVWTNFKTLSSFIPLRYITGRAVFVDAVVDFGRHIGKDKVLVSTPIPFFC